MKIYKEKVFFQVKYFSRQAVPRYGAVTLTDLSVIKLEKHEKQDKKRGFEFHAQIPGSLTSFLYGNV